MSDGVSDLHPNVRDAIRILVELGFPRAQQNERSALCLLALLNLTPGKPWKNAESPALGITPMMDWMREHYHKDYKPNTRETVRRQTMHQFCDAGIALYNPDKPGRAVNSPQAVYQIEAETLALLRQYGKRGWKKHLNAYLAGRETLVARYARERDQNRIPVTIAPGMEISLSPGEHSELIRAIIEDFGPRFVQDAILVYVGDTGEKGDHPDGKLLADLGISIDSHGKMPDVVLYDPGRRWLILVEAVTSHGPVDGKRHDELHRLFKNATAGLVFVTAFPSRSVMGKYLAQIAWETEVWIAEAPSHLIHFDGERFLGPYDPSSHSRH